MWTSCAVDGQSIQADEPASTLRPANVFVSDLSNAVRANQDSSEAKDAVDQREQKTLEFVEKHQPELADLLDFLRAKRSGDYRQAIDEISRVRERLDGMEKRDRELYEIELALWQNSARLRLWAASVSASAKKMSEVDRKKLTDLVTRENDLMLKRLRLEKARAESRLEQIQQQLDKRAEQTDAMVAKGIKVWEGRIERPKAKSKSKVTEDSSESSSEANSKSKNKSEKSSDANK